MELSGHKRGHQIAVTASSGHLGSGHLCSCQATGQWPEAGSHRVLFSSGHPACKSGHWWSGKAGHQSGLHAQLDH